jgi:hypothetical protein
MGYLKGLNSHDHIIPKDDGQLPNSVGGNRNSESRKDKSNENSPSSSLQRCKPQNLSSSSPLRYSKLTIIISLLTYY